MKVVRAIRKEDLEGLLSLATKTGGGMTTLKPDKKMLSRRIDVACDSFSEKISPEHRDYLFVLEETDSNELIGVCAIKSRVGLEEPFYNYRIGTLVHSSKALNVYLRMDTLYLSNDLTGSSELCSLFLHPEHRSGINGKLLSKSRFLFIAQFPHLFNEKFISELRGFQRPDGSSPFWDNLGRHFFKMDFNRADDLSIVGKKSFIAELMPRYPLYVTYLAQEAQEVIGKVHVDTAPARRLLEEEGFSYQGYVDIFDAGPVLQARINELRSAQVSELVEVETYDSAMRDEPVNVSTLVANTNLKNYRAIVSNRAARDGKILLTDEQQQVLCCALQKDAQLRVMPLSVKKRAHEE
jgi:arginine N-succinyltransferase